MTTPHGRELLRDWLGRSIKSQKELASDLQISNGYLSQILAGNRRPKLEVLMTIERISGVPIESWADTSVATLDDCPNTTPNGPMLQRVK